MLAEDVADLEAHKRRMADGDGYRPGDCPHCGCSRVHVHSVRERKPHGAEGWPAVLNVRRYRCANGACRAIWLVLPGFLARHLWRVWETVEEEVLAPPPAVDDGEVVRRGIPGRTLRRWRGRLLCAALLLVQVLATSGEELLAALVTEVGLTSTRMDLVRRYVRQTGSVHPLADLGVLVHRLAPGLRLM